MISITWDRCSPLLAAVAHPVGGTQLIEYEQPKRYGQPVRGIGAAA